MASPRVLILGHSFIRRLKNFIAFHPDLNPNFLIAEACEIKWHGVGGTTIAKARAFDLPVSLFCPRLSFYSWDRTISLTLTRCR